MKKLLFPIAALLLLAALSACSKEHQCKCVYADGQDHPNALNILVVDGSIKCEDITEFAFEEHTTNANNEHSLTHVDVHKVNCREYGG